MSNIRFMVMDVDGTLTDGKIYMGQDNELFKAFNIKDGAGIGLILPKYDIIPVIITARESKILENRCKELNITELYQGSKNKLETLQDIMDKYSTDLRSVAYAGDDLPDIPCMEKVKESGGLVVCPADAIPEIKSIADYVSGYKAGEGAIRDCINYLTLRKQDDIEERIKKAIEWIKAGEYKDGSLPDGSRYTIQEYMTKPEIDCILETHRRHIDIQYILEGTEELKIYNTNCLTSVGTYDEEKDAEFWKDGIVSNHSILVPGSFIVIYANQPHKGAIKHKRSEKVKKLVCKIEI